MKLKGTFTLAQAANELNLDKLFIIDLKKRELVKPSLKKGRTYYYSTDDLDLIRLIIHLNREVGVNLPGIEIILRMRTDMIRMTGQVEEIFEFLRDKIEQKFCLNR